MKNLTKILVAVLCVALSMFALTACQGEQGPKGEQGPAGIQGEVGPQGPAGQSAYEIWKAQDGNAEKTVDDYIAEVVNPKHTLVEYEMIQVEDATSGGYGYYKCSDDGCNYAEMFYTNPVGYTELSDASVDAQGIKFTSIFKERDYEAGVDVNASNGYIKVTVAEAGVYNLTFTGVPMRTGIYTNYQDQEVIGGECTVEYEFYEGENDVNIMLKGRFFEVPETVQVSISKAAAGEATVLTTATTELESETSYTFTAETAGTLTINFNFVSGPMGPGMVCFYNSQEDFIADSWSDFFNTQSGMTFTKTLEAGETFNFFTLVELGFGSSLTIEVLFA